jgi:hypothetical protein
MALQDSDSLQCYATLCAGNSSQARHTIRHYGVDVSIDVSEGATGLIAQRAARPNERELMPTVQH